MPFWTRHEQDKGQSAVELALMLPLLVLLLIGLVEVAFYARTYLTLLEASREGARVGARGEANFDNDEIRTLVEQNLSREGYNTSTGLADVIIIRAEVGPGVAISDYLVASMLGSGRPAYLTQALLLSRLEPGDPHGRLIAVEIYFDQERAVGFPLLAELFPDPMTLHAYSIMRMLQ